MKRFKRISAIFLAMALIVGLIPGGFLSVETSAESMTPSVGDNKTWLHAVYDADGIVFDGVNDYTFPLNVALTSEIMMGAAWNLEYLYLAVNSDVEFTTLQVNGKDVLDKSVTATTGTNAGFAEYRISLLDAGISSIASGVNTVTVQIGEETAQTLYLIFENNNYKRGVLQTNNTSTTTYVELLDNYTAKVLGSSAIALYNGDSTDVLKGDLGTPAVVELDLDIDQIFYNSSSSSNETNTLRTVCHGINVQVVDEYCNHNGKGINELFKFGFVRYNSKTTDNGAMYLRHAYIENGVYKSQDVRIADTDNRLVHVRVEYSYAADNNGEISHDSVVSAKYFINGVLLAEGTDVRIAGSDHGQTAETDHLGTSSRSLIRVLASYAVQTNNAHTVLASSNYSISYADPAKFSGLAAAVAVQAQIAGIFADGKITQAEFAAVNSAYEALGEDLQALLVNGDDFAKAQTYMSKSNYLHAVYAKGGEGETPAIAIAGTKICAAWDWDNLYITGADKAQIGDAEVAAVEGKIVISWADALGTSLKADAAAASRALTLTIGGETWTGVLILDTNDYVIRTNLSPSYGTVVDGTGSWKLNSITDGGGSHKHRDILFTTNYSQSYATKLEAALNRVNILEMDVKVTYMPDSYVLGYGDRGFAHGGLSISVIDGDPYTGSAADEGMFTGLVRNGNILYLVYWNGEGYTEVPIDVYQSGKEYHLRIEYTYPEAVESVVNNDQVNAKYYVNGMLVSEDADVKFLGTEQIGSKKYTCSISSNADGAGSIGFFIQATDKTAKNDDASEATRVEVTVKNVSVSNTQASVLNDKVAAESVDTLINAIGTVTLNSKAAIEAAEAAYAALTEAQQALVANYATLTAAKTAYNALLAPAEAVVEQIAALGTVTLDSLDAIVAAEEAYNDLTEAQQALVSNYATLTEARAAYDALKEAADKVAANKAAAAEVDALIEALPAVDDLKLTDKAQVEAARDAYAALTSDKVQYVAKLSVLEAAEAKIAQLQAAADKETTDKAAAKAVDDQIAAIGTVTYSKANAIATVRNAYNTLTDDQKAFVENLETLTNAEAKIAELQAEIDAVEAKIAAIGEVTLSDAEAIAQAKAALEALADDQQDAVENAAVLTAAQATLKALQDAVTAVINQIDAIGTVTLESLADIEAAEAAYDDLDNEQKAQVTNYAALIAAKAEYKELKDAADQAAVDQAAANGVKALINAIGTVSLESKTAIEAAEAAYAALTADQKALVDNYAALTAASAAYDQLVAEKEAADKAAADAVKALIEAIGTVTLESEEAIEAAEAAYAALTADQKALVTNYAALTAASAAYDQLVAEKEAAEKEAADKAVADAAIAKINAIGTVTLDSKLAIEAARVAYNALTAEQKAMVSAEILLKLTNAETALKALETPDEPPKTGDSQLVAPFVLLIGLSVAGLFVVLTGKKKFF